MKLFMVAILAVVVGCSPAPFRTGSIKINKFDTVGFKTSNPIDVNNRVAEDISNALDAEIRRYIKQDSKLHISDTCQDSGYELKGRLDEVSTDTDHQYRVIYVASIRKFKVGIEAWLFRCGSAVPLFDITEDVEDENMMEVSSDLADKIVGSIRRDPSLIPAPVPDPSGK